MSEHISTHKCDNRASCECYTNLISYTLSFLPFLRASFVGRVCGMVQGKTDVIGAEQKWKKHNCDNNDYENQQPISKQYKNGKAVTMGASWLEEGFGLWVG